MRAWLGFDRHLRHCHHPGRQEGPAPKLALRRFRRDARGRLAHGHRHAVRPAAGHRHGASSAKRNDRPDHGRRSQRSQNSHIQISMRRSISATAGTARQKGRSRRHQHRHQSFGPGRLGLFASNTGEEHHASSSPRAKCAMAIWVFVSRNSTKRWPRAWPTSRSRYPRRRCLSGYPGSKSRY